ncbi:glycosyltransferase [Flavobacterium sp. AS60]|uniref:glycosyltransferase n=1 Tax=Flavobacterium anseongense TaxID=2910677 RepID=UPI001F42233A|nr:glycosyltransferase [Flavobacterium sp. AS60]MCF6129245.1 glycosyltransferase [Flavobacterium sp. AS60]
MKNSTKNILVAPLNWGLGHATRCIPIIRELEKNGFTPILASDGVALQLLQKEFPHLQSLELPSYEIEYAKNGADFKWKLIKNSPKMIDAIFTEKKIVKKWIAEFNLQGIISDNRLGVYSKKIPSVFMTHQLNVLSGKTTWISSKLHQHFIKKFTECWIPDIKENPNLTGKLGHLKNSSLNLKYLGPLSRLEKKDLPIKYDLMVILSGPEPQRTFLEEKLIKEVQSFKGKVLFIKGIIESEQKTTKDKNVTYYNFMTSSEIETAFNESETVLCRSGYTTVMDLAKLQKKAFFIPTPGQFEQEYLAKRLKRNGFIPYAKQDNFIIENLLEVKLYGGLPQLKKQIDWKQLLVLFKRE